LEFRELGGTGLRISRVGFGGAVLGIRNYGRPLAAARPADAAAAERLVAAAIDRGTTLFDTAEAYGEGLSETVLGAVVGNRADFVVSSKYAAWKPEMGVEDMVEASLRRLRRDRIDLLQIHGLSYTADQRARILAPGGVLERMERLREAGKVGALGFTAEDNNPVVYELIETGRFGTVQLSYNLVQTDAWNPRRGCGPMVVAAGRGMGVMSMRVMTSGVVHRFLAAAGVTPPPDLGRHLLRFVLGNPVIDAALVGMTTEAEIDEAAAAAEAPPMDLEALLDPFVADPADSEETA